MGAIAEVEGSISVILKLAGPNEPVEGQAKRSPKRAFVMVFQITAVMELSFELPKDWSSDGLS